MKKLLYFCSRLILTALLALVLGVVGNAQIFEEVAQSVGIDHVSDQLGGMGAGGAWFDFDADGDQDLYTVGGEDLDKLFRNNGDGTFTDVTLPAGLGITTTYYTTGVATGDINNDGFREIFVGTWVDANSISITTRNLLFYNNGDGTFTEIGVSAGLTDIARASAATFLDVNRDGFLDLYVVNYVDDFEFITDDTGLIIGYAHECYDNQLYINMGGNSFVELAQLIGLSNQGCSLAVASTDYDQDGDVDIYLANDFGEWIIPNGLFQFNSPTSNFTEVGAATGTDVQIYGMGIAVGDYNLDQHLDFYTTNIGRNVLLQANGDGTFTDATTAAGVENILGADGNFTTSWGTAFIDYDNDMYEDLFVANGWIASAEFLPTAQLDPNKMFHNNGDGTFSDVSEAEGFDDPARGRGLAYCDYDEDGDLDVFVGVLDGHPSTMINNISGTRLYKNNISNDNNWLQVQLTGVTTNRDAFGTRLRLHVGGQILLREISGGSSHGSQNSSIAHFGLAAHSEIDSLEIFWLGEEKQTIYYVEPNQKLQVTQGQDPNISLSFQLNLGAENADPNGVFLRITRGNGEEEMRQMTDGNGDNIYEVELIRHRGYSGYYSYHNGNCPDLSCAEDLQGQACAAPDFDFQRSLVMIQEDMTLIDCFGNCNYEDCIIPEFYDIVFQVNMQFQPVSPGGVFLAMGPSANMTTLYPMTDNDGDDIYEITLERPEGFSAFYTFTNGDCTDLSCAEDLSTQDCGDPEQGFLRFLPAVFENVTTLNCFSVCNYEEDCVAPDSVMITVSVNMIYQDVDPAGVFLAGGVFGEPGGYPMEDPDGDGVYTISMMQPIDFESAYTFANGLCTDLSCAEDVSGQACADNSNDNLRYMGPFSTNAVINTCFGECTDDLNCTHPPVLVTFAVDMERTDTDPSGMYLAADFDNFSGNIEMTDADGDDIWTVELPLIPGTYHYRFVNGGPALAGDLEALNSDDHGDCTVTEAGFTNRILIISEGLEQMVLDTVCFGHCVSCDEVVSTQSPIPSFGVYLVPSLANDYSMILFDGLRGKGKQVRWYALDGRLLGSAEVPAGEDQYRLSTSSWASGLYLIQVSVAEAVIVRKLVVERR